MTKAAMRRLRILVAVAAMVLLGVSLPLAGPAAKTAALPAPSVDLPLARAPGEASAVFAGGCFWGVQAVFEHLQGVKSATSGYAGGSASAANYVAVSRGDTGHAESVRVIYDPSKVSYGTLLRIFFSVAHDPTQLNRQGPDVGSQYRSAIFYGDDEQRRIAAAYIAELTQAHSFAAPIATRLEPLAGFFPAESYHQSYVARHPDDLYVAINDLPKLKALRAAFPLLYRDG
ncbi:MAG: peptide-methionine (S)-S-oxide reductase MsrA [Ignavibacteria bacterium]